MINSIKDTDTHFIIDGSSRLVKNESETKLMLVQYDHNSERFTFRVPRYCDNYDLSLCNYTRVHYINLDKTKKLENHGIDDVVDLDVCPEDDQFVQCSWLITRNATQLAGYLHFVIQFAVKDGDTIKYSWNTAKYTGITIQDGINFDEHTVSENNDLLTRWENRLRESQIIKMEQTQSSDVSKGENVWTATYGDGRTECFVVKNGERGETGLVGSIETVTGSRLDFFVGTKAKYDELSDDQRLDCLGITIDEDPFKEFENGIRVVKRAEIATKAFEDERGNKFAEKYLRTNGFTTSLISGSPSGLNFNASPDGTFYHIYMTSKQGSVLDFGVIWWDGNTTISPSIQPSSTLSTAVYFYRLRLTKATASSSNVLLGKAKVETCTVEYDIINGLRAKWEEKDANGWEDFTLHIQPMTDTPIPDIPDRPDIEVT